MAQCGCNKPVHRCTCHPQVHTNNAPAAHYEGLPVIFAPGFEDFQVLKDHAGCDHIFVGGTASAVERLRELLIETVQSGTDAEKKELRQALVGFILSSDADNNLRFGSDCGIFENDAIG